MLHRTPEEHFAANVDRHGPIPVHRPELGPCWVWRLRPNSRGYGIFTLEGRQHQAHRVAFLFVHGRWPEPFGLHRCDLRHCVKAVADEYGPAHIFEGSHSDNMDDMVAKGRSSVGDRHGLRKHPEAVARGDRSGARTHPERLPRGERHGNAKLTNESVAAIRTSSGITQAVLARRYGVSRRLIGMVMSQKIWR